MEFDKFMCYKFPKTINGYATRYSILFEELNEDEIKKYIEEIDEPIDDPIELWRMMYHDMIGSGKHGC